MRTIKVMADYACWPLWEAGGEFGNVDPASLPLSADLQAALLAWADDFDATLNEDDPASGGFASSAASTDFDRRGRALAEHVARELGAGHRVLYHSIVRGAVEPVPVTPG